VKVPHVALEHVLRWGVRPVYGPPVPIRYQRFHGDQVARLQRVPRSVTVTDLTLGGRPTRRYAGPGARDDAAVLWAHGGAFITGSFVTHGSFAAHLALASGLPVYLPDYRLAPEYPYPAAVDDLVSAARELGTRLVLGGDSAGGCLALLAAPSLSLAGLALVSPIVDLTVASARAYAGRDVLIRSSWPGQGIAVMFPDGAPVVPDPTVPTVVHVADPERLRAEGEALAQRVGAELYVVERGWHDIHLQAGLVARGANAVERLGSSVAAFV
jgi:monoterpene epsilon-lactone hydrolase